MTNKNIEPLKTIGKPVPIQNSRKKTGREWLPIIKNIQDGFQVRVNRSYGGARDAIRRLEESGQIAPGEYVVLLGNEDGEKCVFIAHTTKARAKTRKRRRTNRKIDLEKVVAYIEGKPNFEHTIAEIQQELFGKIGSPRTTPEIYYPSLHATMRARRILEERKGGKFVAIRRPDGTKLNTFQKSTR